MTDVIIVAVIVAIVGLATWYVIRAKKSGKKCIGCPDGCCTAKKGSSESCCCCGDKAETK